VIYGNTQVGVSIGGASPNPKGNGGTRNCTIVNNTLYDNDTQQTGTGEFQIQWYAAGNIFDNNIVYANAQCLFDRMTPTSVQPLPARLNNNLYYCRLGSSSAQFVWQTKSIAGFSAWQARSGQDALSLFADPLFVSTSTPNLDVMATSPAVGAGADLGTVLGAVDVAGNPRIGAQNEVTIGAYQDAAP